MGNPSPRAYMSKNDNWLPGSDPSMVRTKASSSLILGTHWKVILFHVSCFTTANEDVHFPRGMGCTAKTPRTLCNSDEPKAPPVLPTSALLDWRFHRGSESTWSATYPTAYDTALDLCYPYMHRDAPSNLWTHSSHVACYSNSTGSHFVRFPTKLALSFYRQNYSAFARPLELLQWFLWWTTSVSLRAKCLQQFGQE